MNKKKLKQSFAHVDCRCPNCNGEGCTKCDGSGLIGKYVPFAANDLKPDALAKCFRKVREERGLSLADIATQMGLPAVRVSDVERGASRTAYEDRFIKRWLKTARKTDGDDI